MSRIANSFNHHSPHTCVDYPPARLVDQEPSNPPSLMIRVNDEHVDLTHVVLPMDASADPTDRMIPVECDVDILRFAVENFTEIGQLPRLPAMGPECFVYEGGDALL